MWSSTTSAIRPATPPANARDHVHDALASGLFGQCAFDRFDLAANAAKRGASSFFFSRIVWVMCPI